MKVKKSVSIYVLLLGMIGLSTLGGMLAFQLFSAAFKSQITSEQAAAVKPVDGMISQEVIDNLSRRTVISEDELASLDIEEPTSAVATVESELLIQ